MHKKCFSQIRSIKKPATFFKNGRKKIVFITKCDEKNCLKRITLWKQIVCKSQNGNPPPPDKSNCPSLNLVTNYVIEYTLFTTFIDQSYYKGLKGGE